MTGGASQSHLVKPVEPAARLSTLAKRVAR
jgi:hypothetical protein